MAGDDTLDGGAGNDALDGGDGTDTASYAQATGSVTVNLSTGTATGAAGNDTLTSIENVVGSAYDDLLIGDWHANYLSGGAGNDTFRPGADPSMTPSMAGTVSTRSITPVGLAVRSS